MMKECFADKRRRIRSIQWYISMLMVLVLLAGCGGSEVAETQKPTEQPVAATEDLGYSRKPDAADGYVHSHPVGTTVCYDLNGDGIGENITVNTREYEPGKLVIGDASVEFWSATPTGYFTILNVNTAQDALLVGISDYGPSDDDLTVLYAYDGTAITEIGFFDDIIGKNAYEQPEAVCHGNGIITAKTRLDVLGTWNAACRYYADETGIWDITAFYPYEDWEGNPDSWEVAVKEDLIMYEDRLNPDSQTIIPSGSWVYMTGVCKNQYDDNYWAAFRVDEAGKILWLPTQRIDWQTYVETTDGLIPSEDAFDGFFYAG